MHDAAACPKPSGHSAAAAHTATLPLLSASLGSLALLVGIFFTSMSYLSHMGLKGSERAVSKLLFLWFLGYFQMSVIMFHLEGPLDQGVLVTAVTDSQS